jgi:hypothetical protein
MRRFEMLDWARFAPGNVRLSADEAVSRWSALELEVHGLRKKGAQLQDAYSIGYFAGLSLVVSDKAREAIDQAFTDQCTFLPLQIHNASQRYFALWSNIEGTKAVDLSCSDHAVGPGGVISLKSCFLDETHLGNAAIFRLGPKFSGVEDLVTQEFVQMVHSAGLTGFVFRERGQLK